MAVTQKKKLCWNCEGNVVASDENCPYCGVSVVPASLDTPVNLHTPPYYMDAAKERAVPWPPYKQEEQEDVDSETKNEAVSEIDDREASIDEFKNVLLSLLLLLAGSMFFLFGLTLALFSHNGIFTLKWDGDYWFVYSILSLPLLLFGWRLLLKLDSEK